MSARVRELTSEPVKGRDIYRLEESDSSSLEEQAEYQSIILDVWDGGYNAEWQSEITLSEFTDILDQLSITEEDIQATAWYSTPEKGVFKTKELYNQVISADKFPEYCGNFQVKGEEFEIYWENTEGANTIELTSYTDSTSLIEELYTESVPKSIEIDIDSATEKLGTILSQER